MFACDGKRRRPQYCLCSDVSGRLYSVRLTWPDGTVLQVRRAWQGTVLGIAVDLSALPYLLRLLPGPTPSRCPGRSFPVGPDHVGREREASKGPAYPRSEERGWSQTVVLGLRAGGAGRGLDRGLSLLLCIKAGPNARCRCAACWVRFCRKTGPLRPRVYEPVRYHKQ